QRPRSLAVFGRRRGGAAVRALQVCAAVKRSVGGLLGLALPVLVAAQGTEPLRKTDLIRLLSNPIIRKGEVADLVRRNCLAFRPTERDWADLRDLGADADVMSSVGGCAARQASRATVTLASPAPPAASAGPTAPPVTAGAASTGQLTVMALPARATVVAGPEVVRPGRPAVADLRPARFELGGAQEGPFAVQVAVRDSFGNPVPNENVELRPERADMGIAVDTRATDSLGRTAFVIQSASVRRPG